MKRTKVCVIGLGYIGLPTSAILARAGFSVVGVDLNLDVVNTVNEGKIHISEPDLELCVNSGVVAGLLKANIKPEPSDVYIICVPTPFHDGDGLPKPNIDHVLSAANSIAPLLKPNDLVILESTSPVGTTEKLLEVFREYSQDVSKIHLAYCPERVLPGNIMVELTHNDRIVGGVNPSSTNAAITFYKTFVSADIWGTDARTAEMCKLTENSFRDVNIAFANEISLICEKENIDVWELIRLANHHPRVNILSPGIGVGGHCIAIDPWFIVARNPQKAKLIRMAREVNNSKTEWVIDNLKQHIFDFQLARGNLPKVAFFGLAFKADIDDLRESPAEYIVKFFKKEGYDVVAVEPNIEFHDEIQLLSIDEAMNQADILVILVSHREFRDQKVASQLKVRGALDFCGIDFFRQ